MSVLRIPTAPERCLYSWIPGGSIARSSTYPQDLMEVTAGEPVREECLKGLLNGEVVFALVRG